MPDDPGNEVPRSQRKPAPSRHEQPSSPLWFLVVVCGAANAACSARVQWSAADTVEEVRRRCERATGQRRSDYLLVESTRKPMRDHLLMLEYGLHNFQRVRLVAAADGGRLRGGASDVDALLAIRDAITGLEKLRGWSDLSTHRDPRKCEGVTVKGGRVTKLNLHLKGLSGE